MTGSVFRSGGRAGLYSGAVDVRRAADLYAQGRTLRQIAAELGISFEQLIDAEHETEQPAA